MVLTNFESRSNLSQFQNNNLNVLERFNACIFILISDAGDCNLEYPKYGSTQGGQRVTITGSGFSKNQFNYGDGNEGLGNTVYMVSDKEQYECDVSKVESNERRIVCTTR